MIAALGAGALLAAAPAAHARGGCITTLPVTHSLKSEYSAAYRGRTMTVKVRSKGSWISRTKAELYTFGGQLVARSKVYRRGFNRAKRLRMRLRYGPMQSGKYTLVVTGHPNRRRSCGPKTYVTVVEFRDCPNRLPVEFPNPPGGRAGDYGRWLSVHLRPEAGILRRVRIELYDFDDNLFGRAKLKALYGTAKVDIRLRHRLENGGYTLVVSADSGLPRACGRKRAKKVLYFGARPQGPDQGDAGGQEGAGEPDGAGDGAFEARAT